MQQQIQSHKEIRTQVQQLAEARQMGELLAAYPGNHKVYPYPVGAAIVIVLLVAFVTIVLPLTFLPWALYLFFLALLGIVVYALLKHAGKVHRHDQLVLYTAGFIYLKGKSINACRWENIKYILRGSALPQGQGIGDIDVMSVVFAPKGRFNLPNTWEKHARAAICDSIEHHFVEARLPQAVEQYNAGAEIDFGANPNGLRISTIGFRESNDLLPWSMVEKTEVNSEFVIIRKEGRTSDWYRALISTVPNAALLKALLDYRQYHL